MPQTPSAEASADSKPIWLLDVDGVLNLFGSAPAAWGDTEQFTANGYPITWSPKMLARITEIHGNGLAEVQWLTTWGHYANAYLAHRFGLSQLTVALEPPRDIYRYPFDEWWKLPAVREAYDAGNTVLWTDDDIPYYPEVRDWLKTTDAERILTVAPTDGLLPEHLDVIERWLESLRAEDAA